MGMGWCDSLPTNSPKMTSQCSWQKSEMFSSAYSHWLYWLPWHYFPYTLALLMMSDATKDQVLLFSRYGASRCIILAENTQWDPLLFFLPKENWDWLSFSFSTHFLSPWATAAANSLRTKTQKTFHHLPHWKLHIESHFIMLHIYESFHKLCVYEMTPDDMGQDKVGFLRWN